MSDTKTPLTGWMEHALARQAMLDPGKVTLVTLPGKDRWATDGFVMTNLTALDLADAFAELPDGNYTLPEDEAPRPIPARTVDDVRVWGHVRDVPAVVKELTRIAGNDSPARRTTATPWAICLHEEDFRRLLEVDGGGLAWVDGPLWARWADLMVNDPGLWPDPDDDNQTPPRYTVYAQHLEAAHDDLQGHTTGTMLRFVLEDPGPSRTAGIVMGCRIAAPPLPERLLAAAASGAMIT